MQVMTVRLALLRHGRAAGQAPDAELLPEGAEYVDRLAAALEREVWRPAAAVSSPYRRARETARVVLARLAPALAADETRALTPEADPDAAVEALLAAAPGGEPLLAVSHLPLVGRIAFLLTGDELEFLPGTFAEFEVDPATRTGRLLRRIGPEDLGAR